mmetsp:Transcript_12397/g.49687  ORF Transcript_12397/g.49687 Transcript_12397/m.49687 type:complete len:338 (-) Transcript_12397:109-1122(-)
MCRTATNCVRCVTVLRRPTFGAHEWFSSDAMEKRPIPSLLRALSSALASRTDATRTVFTEMQFALNMALSRSMMLSGSSAPPNTGANSSRASLASSSSARGASVGSTVGAMTWPVPGPGWAPPAARASAFAMQRMASSGYMRPSCLHLSRSLCSAAFWEAASLPGQRRLWPSAAAAERHSLEQNAAPHALHVAPLLSILVSGSRKGAGIKHASQHCPCFIACMLLAHETKGHSSNTRPPSCTGLVANVPRCIRAVCATRATAAKHVSSSLGVSCLCATAAATTAAVPGLPFATSSPRACSGPRWASGANLCWTGAGLGLVQELLCSGQCLSWHSLPQ